MKNTNNYQSESAIATRASRVSKMWNIAGLSALVWACISHPSILLLSLPPLLGFVAYQLAIQSKRRRQWDSGFGGDINFDHRDMAAFSFLVFGPLGLIEIILIIFNLGYFSFWQGITPGIVLLILWYRSWSSQAAECYLCFIEQPFKGKKKCPSCGFAFEQGGWVGFKAHWNEHHTSELSYEDLWGSLCDAHRKKDTSYVDPSIETYQPKFRRKPLRYKFTDQKLLELNFSAGITKSLGKHGVTHIHQLILLTKDECLSIHGIAEKTVDIIQSKILMHSLTLGTDPDLIQSIPSIDVADNEIEYLGLSKRTKNLLGPHNIETIRDLLNLGEARIFHLPRFGVAAFDEISAALVKKNIWSKI